MARQPVKLPVARTLEIDNFSGTDLSDISAYMKNAMVETRTKDGQPVSFVTQRPAFNITVDASETVVDTRGRAVYTWDAAGGARYFVNDDTVYKNDYSTVIGTITSGYEKCLFLELGGKLVLLDAQNNQGWTITTGGVLAEITDPDFPADIVHGGAVLDGILYVMDQNGDIYGSDIDDPTAWNALDVISAERETDKGVYLTKHHDHIVAIGTSTIEFFYNAANPVGSALQRRPDLQWNLGCASGASAWYNKDSLIWVGQDARGDFGVYEMRQFTPERVSRPDLDSFLTEAVTESGIELNGSGFSAKGHEFYVLTGYTLQPDVLPNFTLSYDMGTKLWGLFDTNLSLLSGLFDLPIMQWTTVGRSTKAFGSGILSNGDIITIRDDYIPIDRRELDVYIQNSDDYVEAGYIADEGTVADDNITMIIRTGPTDMGTNRRKFIKSLEMMGDYTPSDQVLKVRWSDTDHTTFGSDRTLNTSARRRLTALGSTSRRTWELEYSGDEVLRIEALEIELNPGHN